MSNEGSMYKKIISDHKISISKNTTIDKILSGFPNKHAITRNCCVKAVSEEKEEAKVKQVLEYFLAREQPEELEILFNIVVKEDTLTYLRFLVSARKNQPKERNIDGASSPESSIKNEPDDGSDEPPTTARSASGVHPEVSSQEKRSSKTTRGQKQQQEEKGSDDEESGSKLQDSNSVEVGNLKREIAELTKELSVMNRRYERQFREARSLRESNATLSKEHSEIREQVSQLENKFSFFETTMKKMEQIPAYPNDASRINEKLDKVLSEFLKVKDEINDLREQNKDLIRKLQQTTTELVDTKKELDQLKPQRIESKTCALN